MAGWNRKEYSKRSEEGRGKEEKEKEVQEKKRDLHGIGALSAGPS